MTEPALRRPGIDDLGAIVAFQRAAWREAYTGMVALTFLDDPEQEVRRRERWHRRLRGEAERHVRVATVDATIVGIVTWGSSRDEPPEPPTELMSLYLRRSHWSTGLGTRLLETSVANDPASLWVFEANDRARRFYDRHHFRPDGQRKVDPGTGAWEIRMVRG